MTKSLKLNLESPKLNRSLKGEREKHMILEKCTRKLQEVFLQAERFARSKSHNQLSPLHLMNVFFYQIEKEQFSRFLS